MNLSLYVNLIGLVLGKQGVQSPGGEQDIAANRKPPISLRLSREVVQGKESYWIAFKNDSHEPFPLFLSDQPTQFTYRVVDMKGKPVTYPATNLGDVWSLRLAHPLDSDHNVIRIIQPGAVLKFRMAATPGELFILSPGKYQVICEFRQGNRRGPMFFASSQPLPIVLKQWTGR